MPKKLLHSWDQWIIDRQNCIRLRTCTKENCDYCKETEVWHDFGNWVYQGEGSCQAVRNCQVCGYTEEGDVVHKFGNWDFIQNDSCEQFRRCNRCNLIEHRNVEHDFGEWKYHSSRSCEKKRTCRHCGYTEYVIEHAKRNIIRNDGECVEKQFCPRCEDIIVRHVEHKWSNNVLPYIDCINIAINDADTRSNKLTQLAQMKGSQDPQYFELMDGIYQLSQKSQNLNNEKLNVHPDDVGNICINCKKVVYLGRRSNRTFDKKGFLSYSHKDNSLADRLDNVLKANHIYITRDIRDIDTGTRLAEFMDRIGQSKYVIVIISDSYLLSENCMYEASNVVCSLAKEKCKILPIVVNLDIADKNVRDQYIEFWMDKYNYEIDMNNKSKYLSIVNNIADFYNCVINCKYIQVKNINDIDDIMLNGIVRNIFNL